MRFLIDNQLPRRLAAWVRAQGHDADHVRDLALDQSKDNTIWTAASESGAIIVSKDDDFANWINAGRPGPSTLWLRTGNGSTPELIAILEPVWSAVVAKFEAGERLVEVRR